jgi:hypothetical protein
MVPGKIETHEDKTMPDPDLINLRLTFEGNDHWSVVYAVPRHQWEDPEVQAMLKATWDHGNRDDAFNPDLIKDDEAREAELAAREAEEDGDDEDREEAERIREEAELLVDEDPDAVPVCKWVRGSKGKWNTVWPDREIECSE